MGCSFWGVVMQNEVSDTFRGNARDGGQGTNSSEFGFIFLASPGADAVVTVSRVVQGSVVAVSSTTVPGGATRSVLVPWQSPGGPGVSRYGYFISSTRPVMAWQFNPLTSRLPTSSALCTTDMACGTGKACIDFGGVRLCGEYAYTVDSSLLLPVHALGTSYVLSTAEHLRFGSSGDFPAQAVVVASQNGTQVTIRASATAHLRTGAQTISPTGSTQVTLNAYDVLQLDSIVGTSTSLECIRDPNDVFGTSQICRFQSDPSGTVVSASAPIAVFTGTPCTRRPLSAQACDHLEEQLAPVSTWGTTHVLTTGAAPRADGGLPSPSPAPFMVKVTAACPTTTCPSGTLLTFSDPPTLARTIAPNRCLSGQLRTNDCRLPAGASAEFFLATSTTLTSDAPVQVIQFIPGQTATPNATEGDPSQMLIAPTSQWEFNPQLLVAPDYPRSFARLTWVGAATVAVDGVPVTPQPVPNSQAFWALVSVAPGAHQVTSATPVGVDVHAYDSFVSYAMGAGRRFEAQDAGFVP